MNIGIFTDTYFPQINGVSTSIKTLKDDLEKKGHSVYIFTTTDPTLVKMSMNQTLTVLAVFRSRRLLNEGL